MSNKVCRVISAAVILIFALGCASLDTGVTGKGKLEAKDLLHAGDVAYKIKDYDGAQYFYELVINKYPNTYYSAKAQENLKYVSYQKGLAGRAVQELKDAIDPVADPMY